MSSETSIVQTVPVDEGLTLAECLHQVYEHVAAGTDEDDINSIPAQDVEPDAAYAYLQNMLGLTKEQVSLFAVIFELALDGRTDAASISKTLGVTRTKFLTFKPDLDVLKEQRYINYCSSRIGSSNFFVPNHVINSIAKGERPKPENQTLSVSKFAGKLSSLFRDFYLSDWDFSELFDEIAYLYSHNQDNHLVKSYYAANLNNSIPDYEQVLFSFLISKAICYSQRNFEFEDYARLFMDQDFTEIKWNIEKGQLKLMQKGIVEHASEGGLESADLIRLSEKALKEFIDQPTLEATGLLKKPDSTYFNLINANDIPARDLFFNEDLLEQINSLHNLLQNDNYEKVMTRLQEKNLRKSITILLFGAPGTGKTESVYQLARITGRPIFQVDMKIRDKFVGQSEKNLSEVFALYRQAVKESPITPILLFNEADAFFGLRKTGARDAVDKMENSLQNILLNEMENLDGILMATTNLTDNFDKAFERRFLLKIKYTNPNVETSAKIWQNTLPGLSLAESTAIAKAYPFSGAEISNISRKSLAQSIMNGTEPTIDTLRQLCQAERIGAQNNHIGF